ncbi:MAG TPA: hypothetical protein VGF77_00880 [Allosphingosinicella sp.]|jgi:chromosome segregation ATPase
MPNLIHRLEGEIVEAERRLSFWRNQEAIEAERAEQIREIIRCYEAQLEHLQCVRNAW